MDEVRRHMTHDHVCGKSMSISENIVSLTCTEDMVLINRGRLRKEGNVFAVTVTVTVLPQPSSQDSADPPRDSFADSERNNHAMQLWPFPSDLIHR